MMETYAKFLLLLIFPLSYNSTLTAGKKQLPDCFKWLNFMTRVASKAELISILLREN